MVGNILVSKNGRVLEEDEFIENPESIIAAGYISSSSYRYKLRSCDEGFNTYAACCNCNAKWTIRG